MCSVTEHAGGYTVCIMFPCYASFPGNLVSELRPCPACDWSTLSAGQGPGLHASWWLLGCPWVLGQEQCLCMPLAQPGEARVPPPTAPSVPCCCGCSEFPNVREERQLPPAKDL